MSTSTKSRHRQSVETLRKDGYKVRVYHGRIFTTNQPNYADVCMSKRDAEGELDPAYYLSSFGGFTSVEVTTPDGRDYIGKFNFSPNRQFNRKLGLRAAVGRALIGHTDCFN